MSTSERSDYLQYSLSSYITDRYTEDGHCKGPVSERELRPIRLQWDIPSDCLDVMESSLRVAQAIAADVDLHIQVYCSYWYNGDMLIIVPYQLR